MSHIQDGSPAAPEPVQEAVGAPFAIVDCAFFGNGQLVYSVRGGPAALRIVDIDEGVVGQRRDIASSSSADTMQFYFADK